MRCYGLIWMFNDEDKIFFKYGEREAFCTDGEICQVLRLWNISETRGSSTKTIMVPCQVELNDEENEFRVFLPTEMVDEFFGEERSQERVVSPTEIIEEPSPQLTNLSSKRETLFNTIRELSSRSRILHKEDYPFVVNAFAAQGLSHTPPDCVLYYSRRIGLFHLKLHDILGDEVDVDQYIKGIVTSPHHFSYLQGIAQPEFAKSVKIVKTSEIIFKGCALLGYNDNPAYNDRAEKWIGWNDYTGLLSFDYACTRLLMQKHRDFDSRCAFVMFSATLTRSGKWKVKDVSYSRQEIVENESQMPLDICFVDGLTLVHRSSSDVKLVSRTMKTFGEKELIVTCKREYFDSSEGDERTVYGAVIVPYYLENGIKVEFEAIAVLPYYKWADPSSQFHRLAAILPTWEEHELPTVAESSFFIDLPMEKGYL